MFRKLFRSCLLRLPPAPNFDAAYRLAEIAGAVMRGAVFGGCHDTVNSELFSASIWEED
jgi:hypothetical protein